MAQKELQKIQKFIIFYDLDLDLCIRHIKHEYQKLILSKLY